MYRCVAVSVEGFVQQLTVSYIARGYRFYVACHIPPGKDLAEVDRKIVERYDLDLSKWARARRKRHGQASVQYLRYDRFFVLIATEGKHLFFERESDWRDVRERPIHFAGYSIGSRSGHDGQLHASVRIDDDCLRRVQRRLDAVALHPDIERLSAFFRDLRFTPYAPVCRQLLKLLWRTNGRRKTAGLEPVPARALRLRRWPVRPFGAGQGAQLPCRCTPEPVETGSALLDKNPLPQSQVAPTAGTRAFAGARTDPFQSPATRQMI
jgi:hypothetical protein